MTGLAPRASERMALSSEQDNFARTLYASLGYVEIAPDDPKDRMVVELDARPKGSGDRGLIP